MADLPFARGLAARPFAPPDPVGAVRQGWERLRRANRPLAWAVAAMALVLLGCLVGLAVDPRVVTGAPVWLKPAKFALSIGIYAATLAWLLSFVAGRRRLVAVVSWATAALLVAEMALVALQAARGTTSHFNTATEFDAALFRAMGGMIVLVWLAAVAVAFALWRHRFADPALGVAVRAGAVISVVGMALAFLMTVQTPAGTPAGIDGAHSVGVLDGGPGLPIVGWSTTGGDLRIGHFVGIHALQALPLLAWALARFGPRWLGADARARMVGIGAAAYLGLTMLVTWQALRGQPLLAPDATTAAALGALLGAAGLAVAAVALAARRGATALG